MKKRSIWPFFILVPLLLSIWIFGYAFAFPGVVFEDLMVEEVVREILDNEVGELTREQVQEIEVLDLRGKGIENIDGFQYLTGLKELDLRDNYIKEIDSLEGLHNLETLDLRNNEVESIDALSELSLLSGLDLRGNHIQDIDPLSNLTNLEELNLRDNQITHIEAVGHLVRLTDLNIRGNQISDITPLGELTALEDLNMRYNSVSDIEPLGELPNLRQRLYLNGNPIEDYSPIADFYNEIEEVDFEGIPPQFSHQGGFYNEEIELEISSHTPDATIRYTLDGSEPDENSEIYTEPIPIASRDGEANELANIQSTGDDDMFWREPDEVFKGTVVRARVFDTEGDPSEVFTQTYFVDENIENQYSMPIISLATNSENFFDDETGIYVPGVNHDSTVFACETGNYNMRGREWERSINIEYYDSDGSLSFSQPAGVRIHGGCTRRKAQKTLRIYARDDYGQSHINYQIFSDQPYDQFKRILLRNSGNDWSRTMFRDAMLQSLVEHTSLDTQAYQPSIVFLNGEYWGIHNIRERFDHHYLSRKYGLERDQIDFLENSSDPDPDVNEGDRLHYDNMLDFVEKNDMNDDSNYEYIRTQMDVENYIDHQISHIYFGNDDWPHNNIRYWRSKNEYDPDAEYGHDGRWRWMLFDTDLGFRDNEDRNFRSNTLEWASREDEWSTLLFRELLESGNFRVQFINRFADHMNTSFAPDAVVQRINEMAGVVEPEIAEHIDRWGRIGSVENWEEEVQVLKTFAMMRPEHVRQHIIDKFGLGGLANIHFNLEQEKGTVQVNTFTLDQDQVTEWEGIYFQGVPIEIEAIPEEGYRFVGWSGDHDEDTERLTITLTDNISLTPVFEEK